MCIRQHGRTQSVSLKTLHTQAFLTQRQGNDGGYFFFAVMRSDGEGFVAAALPVSVGCQQPCGKASSLHA